VLRDRIVASNSEKHAAATTVARSPSSTPSTTSTTSTHLSRPLPTSTVLC